MTPTAGRAARARPPVADLGVLLVAGLVPVVASGELAASYWAPKAAVLLVALVPGLVALVRLVAGGDRAARGAAAFLAVALLASMVAAAGPVRALVGSHGRGSGWWFLAALAGVWALGRLAGPWARARLPVVLVGAAALSALVALVQVVADLSRPPLALVDGRAVGLAGNAAQLGLLSAAALWLLVAHGRGRLPPLPALAAVALLAASIEWSGSRWPLAVAAAVPVGAAIWSGRRAALVVALALLAGVGLASAVPAESADGAATQRIGPAGLEARAAVARASVAATAERPVLGWGPSGFREATSHRMPTGTGDRVYDDAHNLPFQVAVTTGLLGLAATAIWLGAAARRVRGPLAVFAVVGATGLLLQPASVAVTPVLALALGAAAPRTCREAARGDGRRVAVAGAVVGLVLASVLIAGEWSLARASTEQDVAAAERATVLLPFWAPPEVVRSRAVSYHAVFGREPALEAEAIAAARRATRREPDDPLAWIALANLEGVWGDRGASASAFEHALARHPNSVAAHQGLAALARSAGDDVAARVWCARLAARVPDAPCSSASGVALPR